MKFPNPERGAAAAVLVLAAGLLVGLPVVGLWLAGVNPAPYLEFPPLTGFVEHAPFSWFAFFVVAVVTLAGAGPLLWHVLHSASRRVRPAHHRFPRFGWVGLLLGVLAWWFAWTRQDWFAPMQPHTFTFLWLAYILVINGLTVRRTGRCLMTERPRFFLVLFPFSAVFWWSFEYLNRFTQNWYYTGVEFTGWEYFLFATLPFSTVLPAVISTQQWLATFPRLSAGLGNLRPLRVEGWQAPGGALLASVLVLTGLGLWPDVLFPFLWIAPFVLIVSLQALFGQPSVLQGLGRGDWRPLWLWVLAALMSGFFWELWNFYSAAKWIYSVPFVERFRIFEMPLAGYAGYLPFGLEAAAAAHLAERIFGARRARTT